MKPAGHGAHLDCIASMLYVPGLHGHGTELFPSQYVPGGHGIGTCVPSMQ